MHSWHRGLSGPKVASSSGNQRQMYNLLSSLSFSSCLFLSSHDVARSIRSGMSYLSATIRTVLRFLQLSSACPPGYMNWATVSQSLVFVPGIGRILDEELLRWHSLAALRRTSDQRLTTWEWEGSSPSSNFRTISASLCMYFCKELILIWCERVSSRGRLNRPTEHANCQSAP
jgi:hypothetical protein